jgi:hypothetical protein
MPKAGNSVTKTLSNLTGTGKRIFVTNTSANEPLDTRLDEALHGAIHLVSRLCDNGISERERTNCAMRARGSLRQLELMIDEAVDLSAVSLRPESGVSLVFTQVRTAIAPQLMERGLGLRVHDETGDASVAAASALAACTLIALAGIAAEHVSAGDELEFRARIERDMLVLSVCPRASHAQGRGFRPAAAPLSAGTGFMLASARRLVEIQGGVLHLPEQAAQGAYDGELRLELPLRRAQAGSRRKVA